ncbi:ABC transporter permease [Chitinophaga defluvii]|uniref:ABC transporter permease n=1 Tax=Chitinophaga defluvii TaxID=3163343 RepID=A0ABV2TDL8_9BACT
MKHIIHTEWLKVKGYRTFWVLLLLAVAIVPAANYITAEVTSQVQQKSKEMLVLNAYDFPMVWQTVANVNSYISAAFGFLMVILVSNEFTFKTHRQNIIDGWERREFVFSKLYWVVAFSLLAMVVAILTGLCFGFAYSTHDFSLEGFRYIFYYTLQTMLSLCLALLAGVFLRRAGLAIVLYLAYAMMIEQLLVSILKRSSLGEIGGLLPLQTGDELLPVPTFIGTMMASPDKYDEVVYLGFLCGYIVLALFLVFRKMEKTDL